MKRRYDGLFLLAFLLSACGSAPPASDTAFDCRVEQPPRPLPAELTEASGAAPSTAHPGLVWTHNDSGTDATLVGVDLSGRPVRRVAIAPATVEIQDWEDTALALCDGASCLYLGDIGDNAAERSAIAIHRVAEPAPGDSLAGILESFSARYAGGPRDSEALFALPDGRLFIVSKGENSAIELYAVPRAATPGRSVTLNPVASLSRGAVPLQDRVTGAAASPDGRWVALRTQASLLLYVTESFLAGGEPATRVDLTSLQEPQGEGVGFGPEGAIVLTSEGGGGGAPGMIALVRCSQLVY